MKMKKVQKSQKIDRGMKNLLQTHLSKSNIESLRTLLIQPQIFDNAELLNNFSNSCSLDSMREGFPKVSVRQPIKVSNLQKLVGGMEFQSQPFKKQVIATVQEETEQWQQNRQNTVNFSSLDVDTKNNFFLDHILASIHDMNKYLGTIEYLNRELDSTEIGLKILLKKLQQLNLRKLIQK